MAVPMTVNTKSDTRLVFVPEVIIDHFASFGPTKCREHIQA